MRTCLLRFKEFVSTLALAAGIAAFHAQVMPLAAQSAPRAIPARERLVAVLDELQAHPGDAALAAQAALLVRNYRASKSPLPAGTVTIAEAPYLGLLLSEKLGDIYPAAYDAAYARKYDEYVVHADLEFLFDQFLTAYLAGDLPEDLQGSANRIGSCLARKSLAGKDEGCVLDKDETHIGGSSAAQLARVKVGCRMRWPGACATRQIVYNEAKAELVKAKKDHALEKPFNEMFPKMFREEFMKELSARRESFPQLLSQKFKGEGGALWTGRIPLVEADDEDTGQVSLRGFAVGLRADVGAAELLARSGDPARRADAAALFYAAANRLLMLTGGVEARWDPEAKAFVYDPKLPENVVDPARPKRAPKLATHPFGGWGLERVAQGLGVFGPWDWEAYDPLKATDPSPLRLFPSFFTPGAHGQLAAAEGSFDPREKLSDVAELLAALARFLRATAPGGAFAPYFGSPEQITAGILDPANPVVFPTEGRRLAVGIAAGALKNLVVTGKGHLDQTQAGTPTGGLGLRFYDLIGLDSRVDAPASVSAVSRLLLAASELRAALAKDPDAPAELQALLPQLDQALQAGALSIGAQGQNPDGGFGEELILPQAPATPSAPRRLATAVDGLRAMTRAYDASRILVLKLNIKLGWQAFDRYWSAASTAVAGGDPSLPMAVEGRPGSLPEARVLWEIVRLWDESAAAVRPDVGGDVNWAVWESRVSGLRQFLSN